MQHDNYVVIIYLWYWCEKHIDPYIHIFQLNVKHLLFTFFKSHVFNMHLYNHGQAVLIPDTIPYRFSCDFTKLVYMYIYIYDKKVRHDFYLFEH